MARKIAYFLFFLTPYLGCAQADVVDTVAQLFSMSFEELLNLEVTTASKSSEKMSDAPATIYLVTKERIAIRGYVTLADLLADIPEIEVQHNTSEAGNNKIAFRGIVGNAKFMIMLDGHRINSPSGSLQPVNTNYSVVNAERVEVILGPASALYGVDAFSGIVNIISKEGKDIKGACITSGYGNYNTATNSFIVGHSEKDISFNVNGTFYNSSEPDFYKLFPKEFAWYNEQYSKNGNMKVSEFATDTINIGDPQPWGISEVGYSLNSSLKLKNITLGFFKNHEQHASATAVKPEFSLYTASASIRSENMAIYGDHEYVFNDDIKVVSQLLYSTYKVLPESRYVNAYSNYESAYKYLSEHSFLITEQLNYDINKTSGLIAGFQYQDITSQTISGDLATPYNEDIPAVLQEFYYLGTDIQDSMGNNLGILQDFYSINYKNAGGFLQYKLNVNEFAKFTLGVRSDYNTRYGGSFSPRLGVVLTPTDRIGIKLLYGSAFLSPSPFVSYQHFGSFVPVEDDNGVVTGFTSYFWHLPNSELKPERLNSIELGINIKLTESIYVSTNGFYNSLTNLITNKTYSGQSFKNVNVLVVERPTNDGTSSTYGGTVRLNGFHTIDNESKFNGSIAYSYVGGEIDGERLQTISNQYIKTNVDFHHSRFNIGLGMKYRFARSHADGETTQNVFLVNLNASYMIYSSPLIDVDFFVNTQNLLNQKYYAVHIVNSGRNFANAPQDPIRIVGGVRIAIK